MILQKRDGFIRSPLPLVKIYKIPQGRRIPGDENIGYPDTGT
jgi:hypothetical protein